MSPASDRRMFRVGLICAGFWGAGTNLLDPRWYPIHGISWGDLLFGAWFAAALAFRASARPLAAAFRLIQGHLIIVAALGVWLAMSIGVNGLRFGASWSDLLVPLRLFYFCAMMVFCVAYVRRFGLSPLLLAFLAGITVLLIGRLIDAPSSGPRIIYDLHMLKDPNVIGNLLGIGVLCNSLLLLQGWTKLPLVLTMVFAVCSVQTFSKGTWLMVALGVAANLLVVLMRQRLTVRAAQRVGVAIGVVLAVFAVLLVRNARALSEMVAIKMHTTVEFSGPDRYRFALAGLYATIDYPVFGLGLRNYGQVERLYPGLLREPSENAHNLFVQIAAVGGIPSFVLFLMAFLSPFPVLWRVVRRRNPGLRGLMFLALTFLTLVVSGSVQLQILAQPFFWFFCGIVYGWYGLLRDRRAAAAEPALPTSTPQPAAA